MSARLHAQVRAYLVLSSPCRLRPPCCPVPRAQFLKGNHYMSQQFAAPPRPMPGPPERPVSVVPRPSSSTTIGKLCPLGRARPPAASSTLGPPGGQWPGWTPGALDCSRPPPRATLVQPGPTSRPPPAGRQGTRPMGSPRVGAGPSRGAAPRPRWLRKARTGEAHH